MVCRWSLTIVTTGAYSFDADREMTRRDVGSAGEVAGTGGWPAELSQGSGTDVAMFCPSVGDVPTDIVGTIAQKCGNMRTSAASSDAGHPSTMSKSDKQGREPESAATESELVAQSVLDSVLEVLQEIVAGNYDSGLPPSVAGSSVGERSAEVIDELTAVMRRNAADAAEKRKLQAGLSKITEGLLSIASLRFDKEVPRTFDGDYFDVLAFLVNETGNEVHSLVEELKSTQAQLLQSQKMDALGKLASGVAHDFNNLLTVVMGMVHLASRNLQVEHPSQKNLAGIREACERAQALTSQLLAFSRHEPTRNEVVVPVYLVEKNRELMARFTSEGCELIVELASEPWAILGSATQFEQVLINLLINADKAIGDGGTIRVTVENVVVGEADGYPRVPEAPSPGSYVVLSVSDTGMGMSESVRARIFEPFFTTRPVGEGSGLGLSTCYGIVKSARGAITVDSEPGRGSTFRVYLPRVDLRPRPPVVAPVRRDGGDRQATILVVDDHNEVRQLITDLLRVEGFSVLDAETAQGALAMLEQTIDILVTDVVMPELNGPELAAAVRAQQPEIEVVFISGYAPDEMLAGLQDRADFHFLAKPFAPSSLLDKIATLLRSDERGNGGSAR